MPKMRERSERAIKAVLFDLDDTLYPERSFVESGFGAVASHLAKRFALDREALLSCMFDVLENEGRGKVFDRVLERYALGGQVPIEELVSLYRSHRLVISLEPDVLGGLLEIRRLGVKLGIITDGLTTVQQSKVAALGLAEIMDVVVYTDSLGREYWKPHPIAFRRALEQFGVEAGEAVYIGNDPAKDFPAPLSLGMRTIHLCRDRRVRRNCCSAEVHVADMHAVVEHVKRLRTGEMQ